VSVPCVPDVLRAGERRPHRGLGDNPRCALRTRSEGCFRTTLLPDGARGRPYVRRSVPPRSTAVRGKRAECTAALTGTLRRGQVTRNRVFSPGRPHSGCPLPIEVYQVLVAGNFLLTLGP